MQFKSDGGVDIFRILGIAYHWVDILSGPVIVMVIVIWAGRKYLAFRWHLSQPTVLLALTPPAASLRTPHATEQLFVTVHSLGMHVSLKERLLGRSSVFSFELVSTRREGIRYIVRMARDKAPVFQQLFVSYVSGAKFEEIEDYLASGLIDSGHHTWLREFMQSRHFALPLAPHSILSQHDPIAYITGSMTKLMPGELTVYQLVIEPCAPRSVDRIRNKLLLGKDPNIYGRNRSVLVTLLIFLISIPFHVLGWCLNLISEFHHGPTSYKGQQSGYQKSKDTLQLLDSVSAKLAQPLFKVSIRTLIVSDDVTHGRHSSQSIATSLNSLSTPGFQALVNRGQFPRKLTYHYRYFGLVHRMPAIMTSGACMLSASEVASLYHFPYGETTPAENLIQSTSKTLAASTALKTHSDDADFDVVLGINKHHGSETAIGLTADERARHVYIIGGTGNGKTTMLEYAIVQDILSGKGVAIIDPHGDSAQKLLDYIPEDRLDDVIYLNPRDLDYPIGLNILELRPGLTGSDLAHEKDLVTEAVISVLRKIFDDGNDSNAYRIERVLRNAIHTAFTVENATLFTVLRLLTDTKFCKQVAKGLPDESLKRFWKDELGKAGDMQRVKITGAPITRIERYERSESAKRILGQAKSTIDFDDIINSSKILICNFSKGRLGEDTSTLFGTTVLAKMQLAAWRRDEIAEKQRVPFYLYVDEFQNFATSSFMELLSEARKYRLYLTMAQQSVSQLQDQSMISTIFDNAGTIICFRSKSPVTEKLLLHQFAPYVEPGEIPNLPSYHFYAKIAAVNPQEPASGETVLLDKLKNNVTAGQVIGRSRENFAILYEEPNTFVKTKSKKNNKSADTDNDKASKLPTLDEANV